MKNRIFRIGGVLLLITALIISLIPVEDVEAATASTSDFEKDGSKLLKYTGTAEVVSIPDDIRIIGEEAFSGNSNVAKVIINDKCKKIEYRAFDNCLGLTSVVIGDGVEEIGSAAFAENPLLKNVSIGKSLSKLGSGVFASDNAIKNFEVDPLNEHLTLENNVLYNKDISKLFCMLPTYEDYEFILPETVNDISGYAFWGNDKLTNVKLGSGLYSVPEFAFSNCKSLRQVYIPLRVKRIDSKAFEDCSNLRVVECPDSMEYIADTAFDGCPKVTIDALAGSYAYNYGQELQKRLIEEIEHEDVNDASIVKQEIVSKPNHITQDGLNTEVTDVRPDNSEEKQDGINIEAKYSTGVIDGKDVVSYSYYDKGETINGPSLGTSAVVGGRALVFIDNKAKVKSGSENVIDIEEKMHNEESNNSDTDADNSSNSSINDKNNSKDNSVQVTKDDDKSLNDIVTDKTGKSDDFPKFTIANNKIATQAHYCDTNLKEYDFPDNITSIGDFAFARTGLVEVSVPDGVKEIGQGAFYHCDDLSDIRIPDSVNKIGRNAFDKTSYVENAKTDFVTVGDDILIAYKGQNSVVNIPEGIRIIADGTFENHSGITAVYIPDSVSIIGEDAFNGCQNLKTVNNMSQVSIIGANAFKDTSLSNVTIPSTVESIGTGAFSLNGGTDTVLFEGTKLPSLAQGSLSKRISNNDDRDYAFGDMKKAMIKSAANDLAGTCLEPNIFGFKGIVVDEFGNTVSDNSNGVYLKNDGGISITVNSAFVDESGVSAVIKGDEDSYNLHISDSQNSKENISLAYSELYGGRKPDNILGLDISLKDSSDTLDINKLGKQTVELTIKRPSTIGKDNMHVVALDEDGQLENVDYIYDNESDSLTILCKHFSPYGIYNYGDRDSVTKDGERIKDDTPDTGDYSISPKWFLVTGCISLGIVLILLSTKLYYKKNE